MTQPAAILFDLDGTLADTLEAIASSMNRTLERFGYPTHPTDAYRRFVGDGVHKLIERALPTHVTAEQREAFLGEYMPLLGMNSDTLGRPYPGVIELLDRLAEFDIPLGVLSNKPHDATVACVEALFGSERFTAVRGQVAEAPVKPDPTTVLEMLGELDARADRTLYVGDSNVDMDLARNASLIGVGAAWGLRGRAELEAHGAAHIIEYPLDLLPLIEN